MTMTNRLAESQQETLAACPLPADTVFMLRCDEAAATFDELYRLTWPNIGDTGCTLTVVGGDVVAILSVMHDADTIATYVNRAAGGDDPFIGKARGIQALLKDRLGFLSTDLMPTQVLLDGAPLVDLDLDDLVARIAARREAGE
ncbi:hypothetical protein [Caenispirillum bisanense]|uniref:Uncharacterized protein n=1 Tax=Caenispirillum bisanense TaxID=414052 RepID=A0A286GYP4_9PROT|nr:hypothetical protein [Caenispirillum bisanense]SOE00602.1 hypothetical protein SAMN05421508_11358 [Caenispirillum bisanense]